MTYLATSNQNTSSVERKQITFSVSRPLRLHTFSYYLTIQIAPILALMICTWANMRIQIRYCSELGLRPKHCCIFLKVNINLEQFAFFEETWLLNTCCLNVVFKFSVYYCNSHFHFQPLLSNSRILSLIAFIAPLSAVRSP